MKKKYFLIGVVFNILSIHSYADHFFQITGTVMDNSTKEVLPNASIALFEKKTNQLIQTQSTDQNGNFKLSNIHFSTYRLQVQYLGYQEYIIDSLVINESIDLPAIYLLSIQQNLSEINVTAIKSVIEQNANSITVNVSESSLATGNTAYEFIKKIPGIEARDNELNIRGKSISLLLNGRLINVTQEEMINILKSLPASSIDKIEVISNPTGKYDGNVQAILDIKTFKPKNDNWGGNLTVGTGAGRKMRSNTSVNLFYKKNKLSSTLGWDYISKPNISYYRRNFSYAESIFNDHRIDTDETYTHVLKLDAEYAFHSHHSIGFFIQPIFNPENMYSEAITRVENKNTNQLDSINYFTNNTKINFNNLAGNIHYQTDLDSIKNKELSINADYYSYNRSQTGNYTLNIIENGSSEKKQTPPRTNDNPLEISIRSATIDYSHKTSLGKWQIGLKNSWVTVDNRSTWKQYDGTNWITDSFFTDQYLYTENVYAAYGGFSGNFKKINLDLFLRAEQTYSKGTSVLLDQSTPRNYLNLFPTLNLEYILSKDHQWSFSYRKNIKRPSYQDLNPFLFIRTQNFYAQGNPFLLPQLDHNWEITYGYRQHVFIKIIYRNRDRFISDIAQEAPSIQGLVRKMENYTSGYSWRVGASINKSILSYWHINGEIQASYAKSSYSGVTAGASYPYMTFSFSSTINLPNEWNLELGGNFVTPWSDGLYASIANYSMNAGLKKYFLEKRLSISLLLSGQLPYWGQDNSLYNNYTFYYNFDSRYFMLSINYKIGNNKNEVKNGKTSIDTEKSRTQ